MAEENFERGQVTVTCPNCGSEGYEFYLEGDNDLIAHISVPCEDCDKRIEVVVDVTVQAVTYGD